VEKPISFLRKVRSFRKGTNKQAHENTKVFCHTPVNCYHICTYCSANIIVRKMMLTSAPHRPPPLSLSAPCWRRRHRYHGRRVAATIAAVVIAAAAATATAATISAATVSSAAIATAFWLNAVCPRAASPASATVACPCRCGCWLTPPSPLSPRPQTAAPCSFRRSRFQNIAYTK
jgi:hypothetical protein